MMRSKFVKSIVQQFFVNIILVILTNKVYEKASQWKTFFLAQSIWMALLERSLEWRCTLIRLKADAPNKITAHKTWFTHCNVWLVISLASLLPKKSLPNGAMRYASSLILILIVFIYLLIFNVWFIFCDTLSSLRLALAKLVIWNADAQLLKSSDAF